MEVADLSVAVGVGMGVVSPDDVLALVDPAVAGPGGRDRVTLPG